MSHNQNVSLYMRMTHNIISCGSLVASSLGSTQRPTLVEPGDKTRSLVHKKDPWGIAHKATLNKYFVSGNSTDPQVSWYPGIKGQGVWSFPVTTLLLVPLGMRFITQSAHRWQMGHAWPTLIGWISLYYIPDRLAPPLQGPCRVTGNSSKWPKIDRPIMLRVTVT